MSLSVFLVKRLHDSSDEFDAIHNLYLEIVPSVGDLISVIDLSESYEGEAHRYLVRKREFFFTVTKGVHVGVDTIGIEVEKID